MKKYCKEINIRSATVKDVDNLIEWWADGKVMAHAGFPNGLKANKGKLIERVVLSREETNPKSEILIITCDNVPIGEMSYRIINPSIFEIGIKICDFDYHNKGIGSKVVNMLLDYLFNDRAANSVVLNTNLKNTGAQRFYERLGFEKTDIKKDFWKDQLGVFQTAVFYKMNKEKYSTLIE